MATSKNRSISGSFVQANNYQWLNGPEYFGVSTTTAKSRYLAYLHWSMALSHHP